MAKRKDSRGRVLNDGEIQRKDGKYAYQYVDVSGKRKTVYSWRLIESDRTPAGKKKDEPLREKEKKIKEDIANGLISCGGNMNVTELLMKYASQKNGVKHKTKLSYQYAIDVVKREGFGNLRIDRVKISDAKQFFIDLQNKGKKYGTIYDLRGVIKPAFKMAMDDDLIRKNPFDFKLSSVIEEDSLKRISLTEKQEESFLDFIKNDKHFSRYYDSIYVLFNTGLRISELCGLTVSDLDFDHKKIIVKNQLLNTGKNEYKIITPKSCSGIREVPMTQGVFERLKRIVSNRESKKVEPMIDGKTGFLFFNSNGFPTDCHNWDSRFRNIMQKYNKTHGMCMPNVTPHVCRHTFCSKMARNGMNPKTLQFIVGHSDIKTTMNTYVHVDFETVKDEMSRISRVLDEKRAL